MVEPSFLALTSTPSIAPSSLEDTSPVSAVCACAPNDAVATRRKTAAAASEIWLGRMDVSRGFARDTGNYRAFSPAAEADVATARQPVRHEVVTHVLGTFRYPCLRAGHMSLGALGGIRTPDPQIRSLVLYPAELRAPKSFVTKSAVEFHLSFAPPDRVVP